MKKLLKKIIDPIAWGIVKLAYCGFDNPSYSPYLLLKFAFAQKVLGINRGAKWPMHYTSQVKCPENIERGTKAPGSAIGCYLDGRNGIIVGENVFIGPRVSIISMNHENYDYNIYIKTNPVIIGKNSLLTTNCVILPAVELGEHTIVAAGAVVTKSFPEGNQVLVGNPARVLKKMPPYKG